MPSRIRTSTQVSFANFERNMQALGQRVYRRSNDGVKEVAIVSLNNLIDTTPKLTKQAASNWQIGLDSPPPEFKEGFTDTEQAKRNGAEVVAGRVAGQKVHITNNTPYIAKLNEGSSKQAPAGFIEDTLVKARIFAKNFKLLKNG